MALFMDGNISSIDDLRSYDTSVLRVADAEKVDLSAKLELARTEIGIELEEFISRRCGREAGWPGSGAPGLQNVVITPVLKQWHTLRTLALVYADVHANLVDSRYKGKWEEHWRRARWAAEMLFRTGLGFVSDPVARAARPEVRVLPGDAPASVYGIAVAWRNRREESGAASDTVIQTLSTSGLIAVRAVRPPANAAGFDVYAGTSPEVLSRQNTTPIEPDGEWVLPATGLVSGDPPPVGQQPEWVVRNDRVLQRG